MFVNKLELVLEGDRAEIGQLIFLRFMVCCIRSTPRPAAYAPVPERLFEWGDIVESPLAPDTELCSALRSLAGQFLGSVPKGPRYPTVLQWLGRNPSVTPCRILDHQPKQFPAPSPDESVLCHP